MCQMSDVTHILSQIKSGDPLAAEQLLPLVYDELRKLAAARLAQEAPGQTLQATALVHESYLRLVGSAEREQAWENRGHFFAAAAEAMRRILIEQARSKHRQKRGGGALRVSLEAAATLTLGDESADDDLLALDAALTQLEAEAPEKAQVVKLRYFAGLTLEQTAASLGISLATVKRHWVYARAWLYGALHDGEAPSDSSVN